MRSINRFTVNGSVGSVESFEKAAKIKIATDRPWINDAGEEKAKTDWVTVTVLDERHAAWVIRSVKKGERIQGDRLDELARRYQTVVKASSKTEAVRQALQHALDEQLGEPVLADIAAEFARELVTKANPENGRPADKAFRDGLYD